jgi:GNAT superfamily N-acetyltransferase
MVEVSEYFPGLKLTLGIHFRLATKEDLPLLEWYGQYTHFRRVFAKTFREQQLGSRVMLVADLNGFPVGQIFILLHVNQARGNMYPRAACRGYLYSLRVMDHLQGMGIGTRLIQEAEKILKHRGLQWAIISVAKNNSRARQLYERLGYRVYTESPGDWQYVNHLGKIIKMHEPSWMLEKRLKNA